MDNIGVIVSIRSRTYNKKRGTRNLKLETRNKEQETRNLKKISLVLSISATMSPCLSTSMENKMNSRSVLFSLCAASAIALTGCEWGSSGDNTWNDSFAWANFTGTYRFTKAVVAGSTEDEDNSASTGAAIENVDSGNGTMTTDKSASGKVSPVGNGIKPGTFSMKINSVTVRDTDGDGNLKAGGSTVGSVTYSSGYWSITSHISGANAGTAIAITYTYFSNNGTTPKGTTAVALSYLNVVQKGNKITLSGDSGQVYSGQLTGSSMSADGYAAAQTVHLSFSASSSSGRKITGSLSGVWSGASDKNYGTLSSRQIHGTFSNGTTFVGTAADVTIHVPDTTVSE